MEKIEIEDLLIAILSQLPRKSIFRFMCVSKRWNNILNDPFFFHSYIIARKRLSSNRPLAFIEINRTIVKRRSGKYCNHKDCLCPPTSGQQLSMKILPVIDQSKDHEIEQVPNELGYFIGCSEGLILCGYHFKTYNILNPVKRTCVSLPLPEVEFFPSMGFVCGENINNINGCEQPVSNFKVICADVNNDYAKTLLIQTYYSNTGKWTNSTLIATGAFNLQAFRLPFVFNGVFHWFCWNKTLAMYDSNGHDNHVQLIILPDTFGEYERIFSTIVTRSSSDNALWFGVNKSTVLEFWMLPKDQNNGGYKRSTTIPGREWILKHKITHESVRQDVVCAQDGTYNDDYIKRIRFVDLEWMIPGKPFVAVLRLGGLMCLYNFETREVELVPFDDHHIADLQSTKSYCSWYPYMAPRSLSSYAV